MRRIHISELPVTAGMLDLAAESAHLTEGYMCYWIAFNGIYTHFAVNESEYHGLAANSLDDSGEPIVCGITLERDQIKVAKYKLQLTESKQIEKIIGEFDNDLRLSLVGSCHTEFFVNRVPQWEGKEIKQDGWGQQLNGIINVGYTSNPRYPIWQPINRNFYAEFQAGNTEYLNILAEEVVWILYGVRNNLFHADKLVSDADDEQVLAHALELLKMIIFSFLEFPPEPRLEDEP